MEEGLKRDCLPVESKISKANCEAWYRGMAQSDLDTALAYIEDALDQDPHRPDFLDTLAVVQEGRGDYKAAREASWQAARYSPEMLYHLWQFRRMDTLATTQTP
jgi:Tfp pilus assembly protein PilF